MKGTETNGRVGLDQLAAEPAPELSAALDLVHMLASDVGPRRPCSEAERDAATRLAAWLRQRGVDARIEEFDGYSSFALPYAILFASALAGGLLQRSGRRPLRRAG